MTAADSTHLRAEAEHSTNRRSTTLSAKESTVCDPRLTAMTNNRMTTADSNGQFDEDDPLSISAAQQMVIDPLTSSRLTKVDEKQQDDFDFENARPSEFAKYLAEGDVHLYPGAVGGCIGGYMKTRDTQAIDLENQYTDYGGTSDGKCLLLVLFDVDYMTSVLQKTDHIIAEKKAQIRNWEETKKRILVVLIIQALFGVFIACWKTFLQPDFVSSSEKYLQPVDVVFLLDTSAVMKPSATDQEQTVLKFATKFSDVVSEMKEEEETKSASWIVNPFSSGGGGQRRMLLGDEESSSSSTSASAPGNKAAGNIKDKISNSWPTDHSGLRMSLTRFASVLPNGAVQDMGLTEIEKDRQTGKIDESKLREYFAKLKYSESDAAVLPALEMCGKVLEEEDDFQNNLRKIVADTEQKTLDVNVPIGCLVKFEGPALNKLEPCGATKQQLFPLPSRKNWFVDIDAVENHNAGADNAACSARQKFWDALCNPPWKKDKEPLLNQIRITTKYVSPPAWRESEEHFEERKQRLHKFLNSRFTKQYSMAITDAQDLVVAMEDDENDADVYHLPSGCFAYIPEASGCTTATGVPSPAGTVDGDAPQITVTEELLPFGGKKYFYQHTEKPDDDGGDDEVDARGAGQKVKTTLTMYTQIVPGSRAASSSTAAKKSKSQSCEAEFFAEDSLSEQCGWTARLYDVKDVDWVEREKSRRFCVLLGDPSAKCEVGSGKAFRALLDTINYQGNSGALGAGGGEQDLISMLGGDDQSTFGGNPFEKGHVMLETCGTMIGANSQEQASEEWLKGSMGSVNSAVLSSGGRSGGPYDDDEDEEDDRLLRRRSLKQVLRNDNARSTLDDRITPSAAVVEKAGGLENLRSLDAVFHAKARFGKSGFMAPRRELGSLRARSTTGNANRSPAASPASLSSSSLMSTSMTASAFGDAESDTSRGSKTMAELDASLVFLFFSKQENLESTLLSRPSTRTFFERATDCVSVDTGNDQYRLYERGGDEDADALGPNPSHRLLGEGSDEMDTSSQQKRCAKFVIAKNEEEMDAGVRRLADLVKNNQNSVSFPNEQKDWRYLFFLLLVLPLILFLVGNEILAKIVQWKTKYLLGANSGKKCIKVTKQLVEKQEDTLRPTVKKILEHQEVELSDLENLRPLVHEGEMVTFRARLNGGYLKFTERKEPPPTEAGGFDLSSLAAGMGGAVPPLGSFHSSSSTGSSDDTNSQASSATKALSKTLLEEAAAAGDARNFGDTSAGENENGSSFSSTSSSSKGAAGSSTSGGSSSDGDGKGQTVVQKDDGLEILEQKQQFELSGTGKPLEGLDVTWTVIRAPIKGHQEGPTTSRSSRSTRIQIDPEYCFSYGDVIELRAEIGSASSSAFERDAKLGVAPSNRKSSGRGSALFGDETHFVLAYDRKEQKFVAVGEADYRKMQSQGGGGSTSRAGSLSSTAQTSPLTDRQPSSDHPSLPSPTLSDKTTRNTLQNARTTTVAVSGIDQLRKTIVSALSLGGAQGAFSSDDLEDGQPLLITTFVFLPETEANRSCLVRMGDSLRLGIVHSAAVWPNKGRRHVGFRASSASNMLSGAAQSSSQSSIVVSSQLPEIGDHPGSQLLEMMGDAREDDPTADVNVIGVDRQEGNCVKQSASFEQIIQAPTLAMESLCCLLVFAVVPLRKGIDGHRIERASDEACLRPCVEFFEPLNGGPLLTPGMPLMLRAVATGGYLRLQKNEPEAYCCQQVAEGASFVSAKHKERHRNKVVLRGGSIVVGSSSSRGGSSTSRSRSRSGKRGGNIFKLKNSQNGASSTSGAHDQSGTTSGAATSFAADRGSKTAMPRKSILKSVHFQEQGPNSKPADLLLQLAALQAHSAEPAPKPQLSLKELEEAACWGYWLIDRVIDDDIEALPLDADPCEFRNAPLKIGDKIALLGMNEKYLQLNRGVNADRVAQPRREDGSSNLVTFRASARRSLQASRVHQRSEILPAIGEEGDEAAFLAGVGGGELEKSRDHDSEDGDEENKEGLPTDGINRNTRNSTTSGEGGVGDADPAEGDAELQLDGAPAAETAQLENDNRKSGRVTALSSTASRRSSAKARCTAASKRSLQEEPQEQPMSIELAEFRPTEVGNLQTYTINPFLPMRCDADTMDDPTTHFVIEKMGLVSRGGKKGVIHDGLHICLRPLALAEHFVAEVRKEETKRGKSSVPQEGVKSVVENDAPRGPSAEGQEAAETVRPISNVDVSTGEIDNGIFPIGMCTDPRIEFVIELVPVKQLAKIASRARREKEKLTKGDCALEFWDPWKKKQMTVEGMQAGWNEIHDLANAFQTPKSGDYLHVVGDYDYTTRQFGSIPFAAKRDGWAARLDAPKMSGKSDLYAAAVAAKLAGAKGVIVVGDTEEFRVLQLGRAEAAGPRLFFLAICGRKDWGSANPKQLAHLSPLTS
eukprot:g9516.t1